MSSRTEQLKTAYRMERHVEGGFFSGTYTAPFEQDGRPFAGSIHYLLEAGEISRFHQIDCDEIWYYHEGCGLRITALDGNGKQELLLGGNVSAGERACIRIPAGCVFAAENLDRDGYTFVSCLTVPKFKASGYRLIGLDEIRERFPEYAEEVARLAW